MYRLLAFVLVGLLFQVKQVVAQSDYVKEVQAREALEEGQKAFENQEFKKSVALFRKAYEMKPSWRLLFNIGQAEAAAKEYGPALQAFEEYLSKGGDDITFARRDEVLSEITRMREMVGFIEIEAPADCKVFVDNVHRATTPMAGPLVINAGLEYNLKIQKDNQTLHEQKVRVVSKTTRRVRVKESGAEVLSPKTQKFVHETKTVSKEPPEDKDETLQTPKEDEKPNAGLKTAGFITLGTGAGLLVGAGILGAVTLSQAKTLDKDYPEGLPQEKAHKIDEVDKKALVTNILFAGAGTMVAAGTVLLLLNRKKNKNLSFAPFLAPGVASVLIGGNF